MSRPPFSRKRKGKTVDPYPLSGKEKSKSQQTKGSRGRPRKPTEARPEMNEERFWALIKKAEVNPKKMEDLLMKESPRDIVRFQIIWDQKIEALFHHGIHDALQDLGGYGDGLDYAVFGVVAQGEDSYNKTIRDAGYASPDEQHELFSYAALEAYEKKTEGDLYDSELYETLSKAKSPTVYNTPESIDDLKERGYALAFDFPDRESAREQVAELTAQGHKAKIIPINDFSEYEVWAKRKSEKAYSLGDRVLVFGTWYTVDDIADSGTLELVDEGTMETLLVEKSQFHNIEEHEK